MPTTCTIALTEDDVCGAPAVERHGAHTAVCADHLPVMCFCGLELARRDLGTHLRDAHRATTPLAPVVPHG